MQPSHPPSTPAGSLRQRLLSVFFTVLLLALLGSAIGIWSLHQIHQAMQEGVQQSVATERLVADAYRHQAINAERYKAMALSSEPEVGEILGRDIAAAQKSYDTLITALHARLQTSLDQQLLAQIQAAGKNFTVARTELVSARDAGLTARIQQVYDTRFVPASSALLHALDTLVQSQRQALDAGAAEVASRGSMARAALWTFGALSLALGTLLALWLVRSITRPMALAGATADRVAGLDLRQDITGYARDEAGRMLASLAVMQNALRALVGQVRGSAHNVSSAAADIAHGNTELSGRTEETAASLQQTAAALEHITVRVQQSAETARQAQQMAATATAVAHQGGQVVSQVETTMQDIQQSAGKIVDIIGVIDTIAFQTNILALNAAVEAAHAGAQGRGFAVVAAEVRSLATRSAVAAQEIKALITASAQQVGAGASLVHSAGATMRRIMDSTQQAEHMLTEITSATQEQNRDIAQISSAVARLDQMTQANSALVEESAAASTSLRSQAQELSALISRFVLPDPSPQGQTFAASPGAMPRLGTARQPLQLAQAAGLR